jgi:hypothetical protein
MQINRRESWDGYRRTTHPARPARNLSDPDVIREIADRLGECSGQPFLIAQRHLGIDGDHRFAATVRQAARGILKVIARASRKASSVVTSGAKRTPQIAGPQATLSIATTALSPTAECGRA